MNAVAYLRVSGASQIEGTGFDRQLDACQRQADAMGATIEQVFREEAISGTAAAEQRPAFQAMTAYLLDRGSKTILVEGMDRLAREYRIQEHLLLYLAAKGFQLYAANTGECITDAMMADPMKKALVQIQGVFAELDKSLIVAKLQKGRARTKSKLGRCEGQKPFGHYPEETSRLAMLQHLRGSGLAYKDIAARLNADGVPPRSGARWYTSTVFNILARGTGAQKCAENALAVPAECAQLGDAA